MSMQEWPDDHLDDLFRKSAEEFDVPFDPAHWADMNSRLDEHDRQGFYDRWRVGGGAAALTGLLLITLWWAWKVTTVTASSVAKRVDSQTVALRKKADSRQKTGHTTAINAPAVTANKHHSTDSRPTPGVVKQPVATPDWAVRSRETAGQWRRRAAISTPNRVDGKPHRPAQGGANRGGAVQPASTVVVAQTSASTVKTTTNGHRSDRSPEPTSTNASPKRSGGFSDQLQPTQPANLPTGDSGAVLTQQLGEPAAAERLLLGTATPVSSRTAVKVAALPALTAPEWDDINRPAKRIGVPVQRFSIMAVVSPDLSSIGLRDFTRPGTNAGLMIQYRLSNRFSLQTGALITTKKYQTTSEYYVWPDTWAKDPWPSNISGTCTMYDIPLNLRFDWLLRPMGDGMPPARWFASAGFTSYFIKREIYTYDYDNPSDPRIMYRGWDNQKAGAPGGKFGFSNLNVSVGYERPMGQHLSWQVEPFMKIPLQQVGIFKVRILSTGAFIGLKYSL